MSKDITEYETRDELKAREIELDEELDEASPCNCANSPPCNRCILQCELDDIVDAIAEDDRFQQECEADINFSRYG